MSPEQRLEHMEKQVDEVKTMVSEILVCLKGNDMGSTGLVKEMLELTKEVEDIKLARSIEKARSDIYQAIIKWLIGAIAALVITGVYNYITDHIK
jgi:hypothetical protein